MIECKSIRVILLAWLTLIVAFLIYLPPDLSVSLTIPPDSSEYSIGLVNFFRHGRFGFTLNGQWYPSRYPPWFSLSCLSPAYLLGGGDVLCLYWAVLAFSVALVMLMYKWGRVLGLGMWSFIPPVLMMFLPDFVFYSRVVMTELPYATLFAGGALMFLSLSSRSSASLVHWLAAGMLVAWSGMARSTGLSMLLPFAILLLFKGGDGRFKINAILLLFLPAIAYEVANLAYNWFVFGSPLRSGYQFWLSVPYDFPNLVFNYSYVIENAWKLIGDRVIQLTLFMFACTFVAACLMLKGMFGGINCNKRFLAFFAYLAFQTIVLVAIYIGYYWADTRFFLPVTICIVPLFFYCLWKMSRSWACWGRVFFLVAVAAVCAIGFLDCPTRYGYLVAPRMWNFRENLVAAEVLPSGSVVIKGGDPNVIDHFAFRAKNLTLLPLVRGFDYVSHMTAPKSIRNMCNAPSSWRQCVVDELVKDGRCSLPFPYVFAETPEAVKCLLENGCRVFFQEVIGNKDEKVDMEVIFRILEKNGMYAQKFGTWTVPATSPNPIRHFYDIILLKGFTMDVCPEITVTYHEVFLLNDKS